MRHSKEVFRSAFRSRCWFEVREDLREELRREEMNGLAGVAESAQVADGVQYGLNRSFELCDVIVYQSTEARCR